jgi:hypothetical protein
MVDVVKPRPGEPPQEIGQADRRALDLAVIRAMGFPPRGAEGVLDRLYDELTRLYRSEREGENVMVKSRRGTSRARRTSVLALAREIWENDVAPGILKWFPGDFVQPGVRKITVHLPGGELPFGERHHFYPPDLADPRGKLVVSGKDVALPHAAAGYFLVAAGKEGLSGEIEVPADPAECRSAVASFEQYRKDLDRLFNQYAESRSADPERRAKIVDCLWGRYRSR